MLSLLFALLQAAGSGGSLPATCTTGDGFYLQTILPPSGWFNCTSSNTWTQRAISVAGSDVASGTIDPLRLGASPAAGKFLRGDSTWQAIAAGGPTYVLLTATRTNATTSYADITDLVIPVTANQRLSVECRFIYSANATTTGIGIGWTGPASPTLTGGLMTSGLTTATVGGTTSVGNDTGAVTTASVATTGNFATFEGVWNNGANAGNVQMRFKSEVAIASAIVIQPGSWCRYQAY